MFQNNCVNPAFNFDEIALNVDVDVNPCLSGRLLVEGSIDNKTLYLKIKWEGALLFTVDNA